MTPVTEVLIPHLDRIESLRGVLRALEEQTLPTSVCIIDNGSRDGSREAIQEGFPEVRLVALRHNHGFGAAVNRGAEHSQADLLILLNNDAVPDPRFVEALVNAWAVSEPEMVAACLRQMDGTVDTAGVEIDRRLVAYDLARGANYVGLAEAAVERTLLAPSGGGAAYLRSAFAEVGGFDEGFHAYLEDVDLGIRMRIAGMRCVSACAAFAWHEQSATLGGGSTAKNRLMGAGRARLLSKYGRALTRWDRMGGLLTDAVVYGGQFVVDRNLGGLRGRCRSSAVIASDVQIRRNQLRALPCADLSIFEGLQRRRARR